VAMYAACVAAEKAARPEALKDIGGILKDTSWERLVRPSAVIQRIFDLTFGDKQLSWICVRRSITVSIVVTIIFSAIMFHYGYRLPQPLRAYSVFRTAAIYMTVFVGLLLLPDYMALGKTRAIISWTASKGFALRRCFCSHWTSYYLLRYHIWLV
jgi:hypothetical protein